jgi:DNA polymerase III epsilon subunit-like protein
MMSLDQTLEKLHGVLSAEREQSSRINGLDAITASKIRRRAINEYLSAIDAELQPIHQAIKDLPALPPEEPIRWAQSLLQMSSCLIMEIDTTGLDESADICRVTLANVDGSLFDDLLIKPAATAPITPAASAANGITSEMLEYAPTLPEVWQRRIIEGLQGRYVVSFAQEWDREMLGKAAKRHTLPPVFFLGEDLQRRLIQYYNKEYYIKLGDIAERITGQALPQPANAIDRVKAACAIIAGMAAAVTDRRPPRPPAAPKPEPANRSTSGPDADDFLSDDSLGDLDSHPF